METIALARAGKIARMIRSRNQDKVKLLHGTSSVLKNIIKRKGLTSKNYDVGNDGIFLTDEWGMAERFAEMKAEADGSKTILICDVDADPKHLTPDFIMYDMPEYSTLKEYGCDTGDLELSERCWLDKIESGEVPWPKTIYDWKTSLDTVHSVISIAPIHQKDVKCRLQG